MKHMAGRKKHSAEDAVRRLRRADELAASGKTSEEIAAELEVPAATLYKWRRTYGGMDVDAAKELKELREQNTRLKRLLAEARAGEGCSAGRWLRENSEPGRQRRAVGMLKEVKGMSERLACKAVGLARSSGNSMQAGRRPRYCPPGRAPSQLSGEPRSPFQSARP